MQPARSRETPETMRNAPTSSSRYEAARDFRATYTPGANAWLRRAHRVERAGDTRRGRDHAELEIGGSRNREQGARAFGVTGPAATEQQVPVVILRVSEPWSSSNSFVRRDSSVEVSSCVVVTAGCRGQDSEKARDRTDAELRVADSHSVR